jgi:oxygen-independent coproporphyrinogen-3 oxidase
MGTYVDAVIAEIARARNDGDLRAASTVFVGGGTPSLLPPRDLARLIAAVEVEPGAEVSVECNPESMTDQLMVEMKAVGVNRISIGVQSLVPHVLAGLGRSYEEGSLERALKLIGAADLESFNVDLVYGGAGETADDWLATLEGVLAMSPRPPHISAYALTIEPGTPLAAAPDRHPDDDVQADRYEVLNDVLGAVGYSWYEISNFAQPGQSCRHNQSCWRQEDYLGFGCAAHSHVQGRRFANVFNLERYLDRVKAGRSAMATEEVLTLSARRAESLELGVRTAEGVSRRALADGDLEALDGLVEVVGDRVVLTLRGRLLANEVALRLRPDTEAQVGDDRVFPVNFTSGLLR